MARHVCISVVVQLILGRLRVSTRRQGLSILSTSRRLAVWSAEVVSCLMIFCSLGVSGLSYTYARTWLAGL